ncbi:MAG: alpha/beta hydrolase [Tissierellia bacterium]|nr:alpha/beta hydrolase [Tissierellia bacterium]
MSNIRILGSDLYYEVHGEGIPFLFIHGWGVNHHILSGCLEPILKESQYNIQRIYIDLPGMGKSKAGSNIKNSDDMLDILLEFIDQIIPNQNYILAGNSYGAYLNRALIRKRSSHILGVLLLCPLVYPGYRQGDVPSHHVIERDNRFMERIDKDERAYFEIMNVVQNSRTWELYKRDILDVMSNDNHFLNEVLDGAFTYDVDELEAPFNKPSLILVGRQDTEVGYRDQFKLLDNYPRASFVVLDKAGHNLQIDQEPLLGCLVNEWIDRIMVEL